MRIHLFFASVLSMLSLQVLAASPVKSPMTGIYSMAQMPEDDKDRAKLHEVLASNPHLQGILLNVSWNAIEPESGKYDFSAIDRAAEVVRETGKNYKLKVSPGVNTPGHVYDAGAQWFETTISNTNRENYGEAVSIPIPWDPVYQTKWSSLIQALGQRYSSDPHCVAVTLTCANFMSAEMHMPKQPEDMAKWQQLGLSADKMLAVYKKYLEEWAQAFPNQLICLHVSQTMPMKEMSTDQLVEQIVLYSFEKGIDRFALQTCQLQGRSEREMESEKTLSKYRNRMINGFQSLASFRTTPDRQGSIEMAVLNFIANDAEYWELWVGDGFDVKTTTSVYEELQKAQSMGIDTYRQHLIDSGKYRTRESDIWKPPKK